MSGTAGDLDLGGCDGCSLGCAVTCAEDRPDTVATARRTLVASGLGLVLLTLGPGLVARSSAVGWLAGLAVAAGVGTALLAAVAVRRGRPAGDTAARLAYRILPIGVVLVVLTWLGAAVAFVR